MCRGVRKTYKGEKFRYLDEQNCIVGNNDDMNVKFLINYNTGERFAKASYAFHKYKKKNQDKSVFYRCIQKGYGTWNGMFWYYDDVDISILDLTQQAS